MCFVELLLQHNNLIWAFLKPKQEETASITSSLWIDLSWLHQVCVLNSLLFLVLDIDTVLACVLNLGADWQARSSINYAKLATCIVGFVATKFTEFTIFVRHDIETSVRGRQMVESVQSWSATCWWGHWFYQMYVMQCVWAEFVVLVSDECGPEHVTLCTPDTNGVWAFGD